jgi:hypothetical protein
MPRPTTWGVYRDGVVVPRNPKGRNQHTKEVDFSSETKLPAADPGDVVAHRWRKRLCSKDETRTTEVRPVNETRMFARWKLGLLLAAMERGAGPGRGKKIQGKSESFMATLKAIGLPWDAAQEAQRIGTLPEPELQAALAEARELDILNTYTALIVRARPYWFQANRKRASCRWPSPSGRGPCPSPVVPNWHYGDPPLCAQRLDRSSDVRRSCEANGGQLKKSPNRRCRRVRRSGRQQSHFEKAWGLIR